MTRWSMSLLCWSRRCSPWSLHRCSSWTQVIVWFLSIVRRQGRDELRWGFFVALHIGAGPGVHVHRDMLPSLGATVRGNDQTHLRNITPEPPSPPSPPSPSPSLSPSLSTFAFAFTFTFTSTSTSTVVRMNILCDVSALGVMW